MVLSPVNKRGHDIKLFISYVNFNVVKYAFFHRTAMLWIVLDDYLISATKCKFFNERLLDLHLVPFLRGKALM